MADVKELSERMHDIMSFSHGRCDMEFVCPKYLFPEELHEMEVWFGLVLKRLTRWQITGMDEVELAARKDLL